MSILMRKANTFLSSCVRGTIDYKIVRHFRPLPPAIFHFPVTYRCNGRCVMCNIWKQSGRPELTLQEIETMLRDPLFKTIKDVILTGGEPTLRNDVGEIAKLLVEYCKDLRSISITTNGLIPLRVIKACKETLEACKETKIGVGCAVSLDGLHEYHDKVRGAKNAFKKTVETIFLVKELQKTAKIITSSQATISKWNVQNMYALEKWFKENNVPHSFAVATYRKRNLNEELDFVIEDEYLQKYVSFLEHLKKKCEWNYLYEFFWNAIKYGRKREILCPFAVEAISVDPNGDMYYCTDSERIGNIHVRAPSEIYYDEKNIKYRKHIQKTICPTCLQTCKMRISLLKHPLVYVTFHFRNHLRRLLH